MLVVHERSLSRLTIRLVKHRLHTPFIVFVTRRKKRKWKWKNESTCLGLLVTKKPTPATEYGCVQEERAAEALERTVPEATGAAVGTVSSSSFRYTFYRLICIVLLALCVSLVIVWAQYHGMQVG